MCVQEQPLGGPRIKHVCRAAAVALGQPRAMVPDDIPRLSALPLHEREGISFPPTVEGSQNFKEMHFFNVEAQTSRWVCKRTSRTAVGLSLFCKRAYFYFGLYLWRHDFTTSLKMRLIVELYSHLKLLQDHNWDVKTKCCTLYIDLGGPTNFCT